MGLEVKNENFGYGASQVPCQVSPDLEGNQVLAVLGPNGVGKTALLRCMISLPKWDPREGRIDSVPVDTLGHSEIWRRVTHVPQSKGVPLPYTALETVTMGRSARPGLSAQPSRKSMEMAKASAKRVGITFLTDKPCSQMSGEEPQVALIARAPCTQPKVFILDEPESNLDFKSQLVILNVIRQLPSNRGVGIIINTHYPAHTLEAADKALILDRDKSSSYGGAGEMITEGSMEKAFAVGVKIADYHYEGVSYPNVISIRAFGPMNSYSP